MPEITTLSLSHRTQHGGFLLQVHLSEKFSGEIENKMTFNQTFDEQFLTKSIILYELCLEALGAMAPYGQSSHLSVKAVSSHPQTPALEKVLPLFESFLLTIFLYHLLFWRFDRFFFFFFL